MASEMPLKWKDPITLNEHSISANDYETTCRHFSQQIVDLFDSDHSGSLITVCNQIYSFYQHVKHDPKITPISLHTAASFLPDHALTMSAVAYCLAIDADDIDDNDLPLLRFTALIHDLTHEGNINYRHQLITNILESTSIEKCQNALNKLDEQTRLLKSSEWNEQTHQNLLQNVDSFEKILLLAHFAAADRLQITEKEKFANHPLQNTAIGLIYGGVVNVETYLFESGYLSEIQGAGLLLDTTHRNHILKVFSGEGSLIECPECVLSAVNDRLVAFTPTSLSKKIANAIEYIYTTETLIAQSVIVDHHFSLLELQYGIQPDQFWIDDFQNEAVLEFLQARFGEEGMTPDKFMERKGFGELIEVLSQNAMMRTQQMGDQNRPRQIPHFELFPYARKCDSCDIRPAIVNDGNDFLCESSARKRLMITASEQLAQNIHWKPDADDNWRHQFMAFLDANRVWRERYLADISLDTCEFTSHIDHITQDANEWLGIIHVKLNGVSESIHYPHHMVTYRHAVTRLTKALQDAIFQGLTLHLHPLDVVDGETTKKIHPFDLLWSGYDSAYLMVPAHKVLQITQSMGEYVEHLFASQRKYLEIESQNETLRTSVQAKTTGKWETAWKHRFKLPYPKGIWGMAHRYIPSNQKIKQDVENERPLTQPVVNLSIGIVMTTIKRPISFLCDAAQQLSASAGQYGLELQNSHGYYGGTVDFIVLHHLDQGVHRLNGFRENTLRYYLHDESNNTHTTFHLTASPYTIPELAGLLETARGLRAVNFSPTELFNLQNLLSKGLFPISMYYLSLRERLAKHQTDIRKILNDTFESKWEMATPPWHENGTGKRKTKEYETILKDVIEIMQILESSAQGGLKRENNSN